MRRTKAGSGRVWRLDQISESRLRTVDRTRSVVAVAISPLEVHGPHLPLGQDLLEAHALLETAARRLTKQRPDWTCILLPPIPVACDTVPRLGSVTFPVDLVRDVAYHALAPFAREGFARLAYSSFHGGPRHLMALEAAAHDLTRRHGVPAASLFSVAASRVKEGAVFFEAIRDEPDRAITLEQLARDHHAGFVETSIGLSLWPEWVEKGWDELPAQAIEPKPGERNWAIFGADGAKGLLGKAADTATRVRILARAVGYFVKHTYYGYPAMASAKQGRALFDHLANQAADLLAEFVDRGAEMNVHSPLWPLRDLLLSRALGAVLQRRFGL